MSGALEHGRQAPEWAMQSQNLLFSELSTAMDARALPPRIEEARAELARRRADDVGCEVPRVT